MHDDLLSIGALARAGGLPVSALRFYDAAGVLRPVLVDPATGYRWYTSAQVHTARLVASLRQAGLPVAELVTVLSAPHDAGDVLARHRRRLEEDVVTACAHLDAASALLTQPGRCKIVSADLVAAVAAVRHAVGSSPAWPGLAGILLHLDGDMLRLVGCDRFRLAVATVPVQQASGPPFRVVVPLAFLDRLMSSTLPDVGPVTLGIDALEVLGARSAPLDEEYPDYERLLRSSTSPSVTVRSDELMETVARADPVVAVRLNDHRATVTPPGLPGTLGFSRTFLLDGVRAARAEHVALALDERSALSISPADRPDDVHVVMPVRVQR